MLKSLQVDENQQLASNFPTSPQKQIYIYIYIFTEINHQELRTRTIRTS